MASGAIDIQRWGQALFAACRQGQAGAVASLLAQVEELEPLVDGEDPIQDAPPSGARRAARAALGVAVKGDHAQCAKALVLALSTRDGFVWRAALPQAAASGSRECVKLLTAKARENGIFAPSLALEHATCVGDAECVKMLAAARDPADKSADALKLAARDGLTECVEALLPVSEAADSGALTRAVWEGHADCASLLIGPSSDKERAQALQLAAQHGIGECALMLAQAMEASAGAIQRLAMAGWIAKRHGHDALAGEMEQRAQAMEQKLSLESHTPTPGPTPSRRL